MYYNRSVNIYIYFLISTTDIHFIKNSACHLFKSAIITTTTTRSKLPGNFTTRLSCAPYDHKHHHYYHHDHLMVHYHQLHDYHHDHRHGHHYTMISPSWSSPHHDYSHGHHQLPYYHHDHRHGHHHTMITLMVIIINFIIITMITVMVITTP